jgi:hypothetical protein
VLAKTSGNLAVSGTSYNCCESILGHNERIAFCSHICMIYQEVQTVSLTVIRLEPIMEGELIIIEIGTFIKTRVQVMRTN